MFYEFRQYTIKDGKREKWVKLMDTEIIPFQISRGMVVLGSFIDEEKPEIYYWIRRFRNEKERERLYKAVYQSKEWQEYFSPLVGEYLDRKKIVVKRIVATPRSVVQ